MSQKIIHQIGRTQRIKILQLIKCSQGLSVPDLSARLKMSYMGVKQHCISMEKEGYLKAWRKPKEGKVGRPEIAYLITPKANDLFPQEAHQMTLDLLKEAEKLFGPAAADKLLYSYYETRLQHYRSRLKGIDFETRAASFVKIRNDEGFMGSFLPGNPPQLLEYHSPILLVQKKYPLIARLEGEMVGKLLDTQVQRSEREVAGQYQAIYAFGEFQRSEPFPEQVNREPAAAPVKELEAPSAVVEAPPVSEPPSPADAQTAEVLSAPEPEEAIPAAPEPKEHPEPEEAPQDPIIELDEEFRATQEVESIDQPAEDEAPALPDEIADQRAPVEADQPEPEPEVDEFENKPEPPAKRAMPPAKAKADDENRLVQTSLF